MNHLMKTVIGTVLLLGISPLSGVVWAEAVAVITHPSNTAGAATSKDLGRVFLGKSTEIGGVKVKPVDQDEGSATRAAFYKSVVGKDAGELKAYWSKRIFTGKGTPPSVVGNDDQAVKDYVAEHPEAIGYVNKSAVDGSVRALPTQ